MRYDAQVKDMDDTAEPVAPKNPALSEPALSERTEAQWARARKGSREDERQLFFKLWNFVVERTRRNRCWPGLKPHMEAEDVAQSLWELVFRRGSLQYFEDRGAGSLRVWLGCCLDHHMVDLLRHHKAERRGGGEANLPLDAGNSSAPGFVPVSTEPGVLSIVQFSDWKDRCKEVLQRREYAVWRLRVDDELEYAAIGEALSITPAAARGLLKRARGRLHGRGLLGDGDASIGDEPGARGGNPPEPGDE